MQDVKTVDNCQNNSVNALLVAKQREDVANMRTSLLCCSGDLYSTHQSIRNITVMRVYHQVARIIRYLDEMDKIDDKLYAAIDSRLDSIDIDNSTAWVTLMNMQKELQRNMIESHKLLEPYINMPDLFIAEVPSVQNTADGTSILSKSSRDKLRTSAQQVLDILGPISEGSTEVIIEQPESVISGGGAE